ncbi:xanthine phosphoribosyltransferase [Acrasis kona]|uniref:Xanthine phosphoribosyltransferase n=1 Tax=Acrasis kona TaxID=1008807 RepID=A0AAW2Z9R1_9EUKA
MSKQYITYNQIHKLCAESANKILSSDFTPDVILAIGGGGYIPARILRTFLKVPIKSVSLELYDDITDKMGDSVLIKQWCSNDDIEGKNVLIVDEVDDTRSTLYTCVEKVLESKPKKVGAFVLYNKLKNKHKGNHWDNEKAEKDHVNVDHYLVGAEVDDVWLVYPWEALDIDEHNSKAQ